MKLAYNAIINRNTEEIIDVGYSEDFKIRVDGFILKYEEKIPELVREPEIRKKKSWFEYFSKKKSEEISEITPEVKFEEEIICQNISFYTIDGAVGFSGLTNIPGEMKYVEIPKIIKIGNDYYADIFFSRGLNTNVFSSKDTVEFGLRRKLYGKKIPVFFDGEKVFEEYLQRNAEISSINTETMWNSIYLRKSDIDEGQIIRKPLEKILDSKEEAFLDAIMAKVYDAIENPSKIHNNKSYKLSRRVVKTYERVKELSEMISDAVVLLK